MKKIIVGLVVILILSACGGNKIDDKSDGPVGDNTGGVTSKLVCKLSSESTKGEVTITHKGDKVSFVTAISETPIPATDIDVTLAVAELMDGMFSDIDGIDMKMAANANRDGILTTMMVDYEVLDMVALEKWLVSMGSVVDNMDINTELHLPTYRANLESQGFVCN